MMMYHPVAQVAQANSEPHAIPVLTAHNSVGIPIHRAEAVRERIAKTMPGLDGIRGIAVLLVMVHHAISAGSISAAGELSAVFLKIGKAGWIGVDFFFVLSGFLISSSLIKERGHRNYFKNFYARRLLRIFPLYFLFLFLVFFLLEPKLTEWYGSSYILLRENQIWFWTFLQNVYLERSGGTTVPVGQLWSLAVEEQFYLIWPLAILVLPVRKVLTAAVVICLGEVLLRGLLVRTGWTQEAIYISFFTRIDSLLIGAALAAYVSSAKSVPTLIQVVPAAFSLIILALGIEVLVDHGFRRDGMALQTIGFTAFAAIAALAIFSSVSQGDRAVYNRMLSVNWLRSCGRYSYSMYLFHPPIFACLRWVFRSFGLMLAPGPLALPSVAFVVIGFALSYLVGALSWRLIEHPILQLRRHFRAVG